MTDGNDRSEVKRRLLEKVAHLKSLSATKRGELPLQPVSTPEEK